MRPSETKLYKRYMRSPEWFAKRKLVLERDNYCCQTCLETERLEVHHKTYDRLAHEPLEDLITLCHWCHEAITSITRKRRYDKRVYTTQDTQRITPLPKVRHGTPTTLIASEISQRDFIPQRSNRRPIKSLLKDAQTDISETRQDGRRF